LFSIYYILALKLANPNKENLLISIFNFFCTVFNLFFTLVYSITMIVFSFAFFLNLNKTIRTNYLFSLLTFIGIPFLALTYMLIDLYPYTSFIIVWWIGFPLTYLVFISLQFFIFNKRINKYEQK
jgi:hypothetical protein